MSDQNKYIEAVTYITKEQAKIVGDTLAIDLAESVNGLKHKKGSWEIVGQPSEVLNELVLKYSVLFGQVSIEVSKDAIKKVKPSFTKSELPVSLSS